MTSKQTGLKTFHSPTPISMWRYVSVFQSKVSKDHYGLACLLFQLGMLFFFQCLLLLPLPTMTQSILVHLCLRELGTWGRNYGKIEETDRARFVVEVPATAESEERPGLESRKGSVCTWFSIPQQQQITYRPRALIRTHIQIDCFVFASLLLCDYVIIMTSLSFLVFGASGIFDLAFRANISHPHHVHSSNLFDGGTCATIGSAKVLKNTCMLSEQPRWGAHNNINERIYV